VSLRLPDAEVAFFWWAMEQVVPPLRAIFAERVVSGLGAHPDPGPGDVDRAIRAALVGLWIPPLFTEGKVPPKWSQVGCFDRAAPKRARARRAADVVEQAP
jgi:hypothetical protein